MSQEVTMEDITYECHRCGKEFTNEISHINHMRNIHRKEYECHHCDEEFYEKTSLINHIELSEGHIYMRWTNVNELGL